MSNVSFSMLNQQLSNLQQDEADFKQHMKDQQKVHKEQEKLKKTVLDAATAAKGEGKQAPGQNAMMAYIQALNQMMAGNMDAMGVSVQQMQAVNPLMSGIDQKLSDVSQQQGALAGLKPQQALTEGVEINANMTQLQQRLDEIGVGSSQSASTISYEAAQNNAIGGQADQALNVLTKLNRIVK